MESEPLMPCPVCGAPCELGDAVELCLDADYAICEGEVCGYSATLERHAELARRAEIGALVERIVEAAPGLLTIGRTAMTDGVTIYSAWSSKPFTDERSLLDALRALAKEVGCE